MTKRETYSFPTMLAIWIGLPILSWALLIGTVYASWEAFKVGPQVIAMIARLFA